MHTKGLIRALVGTEKIIAEEVFMEAETNAVIIKSRLPVRDRYRCALCHCKSPKYDNGQGLRRWRCLDVGSTKIFVEAESPRVCCKEHGITTAAVPWARHNSRFCKNFEEQVAWLCIHSSKTVVAELMRIEWHTVGDICARVYRDLERQAPTSRFEGLVNIGIDETSYKKGHKYMTVVINHDTASVIWCEIGYGLEVLKKFFEILTPEQRESIRCVSADGARWIAACVEVYCPNAERCVDPFHVVSWATEALDKVRRKAWADAYKASREEPKRKRGRPAKDEEVNPAKRKVKSLKNVKYALLKNPENLSENQKAQLNFLTEANPVLYRAYLLKENLRLTIKAGADEISGVLQKWMSWAQRCRIPEFRELRQKIKHHFEAIIATAKHKLSNARIEATNNKIKLVIRTAYGFRNTENLISMVMLSCSDVRPRLPGR